MEINAPRRIFFKSVSTGGGEKREGGRLAMSAENGTGQQAVELLQVRNSPRFCLTIAPRVGRTGRRGCLTLLTRCCLKGDFRIGAENGSAAKRFSH